MADEKTSVIIDIKVEADAALKRQQELKQAIINIREEQKATADKASEGYIKNEAQLKLLTQQLNANGNVLKGVADNTNEVGGAYAELNNRAAVAAQRAKDMAVAYGQTDKRTIEATASAKAMKDQLKEVDAGVGLHIREVGNYAIAGKSLKAELKEIVVEMAQMSLRGEENTQAFKDLANRGGELKDTLSDISTRLKNVGSDTRGIDQTVAAFTAMGNVAQIAEGSMALFGTESDEVARSIQKMVAIQSILNGVNEIANALQKESSFMLGVVAVKEKVLAASKIVITNLTRIFGITSTQAWAAATLGVSLLVTGIVLLIGNFNSIISATKEFFGLTQNFDKTNESIKNTSNSLKDYGESTQLTADKLKALGKSEREVLEFQKKRFEEQIILNKNLYKEIAKKGSEATEEEKKQQTEAKDFVINAWKERDKFKTQLIALEVKEKADAENKKKEIEKKNADERKAADTIAAANRIKKQDDEIKKMELNSQIAQAKEKELTVAGALATFEAEKTIIDKKFQYGKLTQEEKTLALINNENAYAANLKTIGDKVISDAKAVADEKVRLEVEAKKKIDEAEALRLEGQKANFDNQLAITEGNLLTEFEVKQAALDRQKAAELLNAETTGADKALIDQKYAQQSQDLENAKYQARLGATSQFLGNIKGMFNEGSKAAKVVASGQVAIDSISGAFAAFTGMVKAIPGPIGIAAGGVAAAGVAASGAKAIADIWKAKPPTGGITPPSVGGGGVGGGSSASSTTGGLVSRNSGQVEQQATQQAVNSAMKANPMQPVLVTNDLTTAQNQKVQLQNDNSL
jgi:hypothetical protein